LNLLFISPLARLFEFVTGMAACSCWEWLHPRTVGLGMAAASTRDCSRRSQSDWPRISTLTVEAGLTWYDIPLVGRK
jgi:hypothetical protein